MFEAKWVLFCNIHILQHIKTSDFRVCLKELYADQHDPVNVSYVVLAGGYGSRFPEALQYIIASWRFEDVSSLRRHRKFVYALESHCALTSNISEGTDCGLIANDCIRISVHLKGRCADYAHARAFSVFSSKDNRTVILTRQDFFPDRTADGDLLFTFWSNILDFWRSLLSYLKFGSRNEDSSRIYR